MANFGLRGYDLNDPIPGIWDIKYMAKFKITKSKDKDKYKFESFFDPTFEKCNSLIQMSIKDLISHVLLSLAGPGISSYDFYGLEFKIKPEISVFKTKYVIECDEEFLELITESFSNKARKLLPII